MSNTRQYPIDMIIKYENDKEYRECIRKVFKMVCKSMISVEDLQDIDDVTLDEYDHDQETMREFLDFVYDATILNETLEDLYKKAAALMISEDAGIGLAVLFSYDYFKFFHPIMCDFFSNSIQVNEFTPSVIKLNEKLSK